MSDTATLHIDGASRGNPGPAAYAIVLTQPGRPDLEHAETIGTATNNVAEYTALVEGLSRAAQMGVQKLNIFSDSELLVRQMTGEYQVRSAELRSLYEQARRLWDQFARVTIQHIPREQNRRADALANQALDGRLGNLPRDAPSLPRQTQTAPRTRPTEDSLRAEAIRCLTDAACHWAAHGTADLPPEAVWDQLWSLLDEAGILKKKAK
ncbi:MAG: ribonuclease HI family protein [Gemmataceae bacterium]|nr:ribonuclease HI family protein [Gemmata sp.]MDW8197662.1 ribonuclease HI family protein [Gemmataceae bacterium]